MGWLDRLRGKKARINVLVKSKLFNTFDLTEDKIDIGRTTDDIKELTIKIPGKILVVTQVNTKAVSRNHATLEWDAQIRKYRLKDHSSFGTALNSKSLHNNNIGEIVENGDNIFITPFTFQLFY